MNEMNAATKAGDDTNRVAKGSPWYTWDIILLGVLFAYGTFGNSFPLLSYWGGLHNDKALAFKAVMWVALLIPVAGICLLAALIRIVIYWPRHIAKRGKLLVLQIVAILGALAYVGLPFTPIGPPGYKTYMWGLRQYARTQVDVTAIRGWLETLDPNECDGAESDVRRDAEGGPAAVPSVPGLPPCILTLEPRYVSLSLAEGHGLVAHLTWGSGLLGTWGLTVAPETVGVPPSNRSQWPDYRLDVSPGVCVWCQID